MLYYTDHAIQRSKERYGYVISGREIDEKGKRKENFEEGSRIRVYFDKHEDEQTILVTFKNKFYVTKKGRILTTYPVPKKYRSSAVVGA
ncbi:MAG: hypothetical protein J6U54_15930 [Clostridiales bacterium]|nr:hypothetical protein [Clostridiales bacterium]